MSISQMEGVTAAFSLPAAPESQVGSVKAWSEPVLIESYGLGRAEKNPIFLDDSPVPVPAFDNVSNLKEPREWQAVHLENEFLRLLILPELGGRVHLGIDKTNGYDFLERQNVIDPLLLGSTGPRVQGGLEFHWPDGETSSFTSVSTQIEEHSDGSRTVWCSRHDLSTRMKGMHGVCLHPARGYVEIKVRIFNRTPFTQTFLWQACTAVPVGENYRTFFPPDFHDHAHGSREDFFGGYDGHLGAGLVHVADHHIAPVKKQEIGVPHHLIAAAYTDGQGGSAFLMPFETKSFSQYWYPIQQIGIPLKANVDAVVSLHKSDDFVNVGVGATRSFPGATVVLEHAGTVLGKWSHDLSPGKPLIKRESISDDIPVHELAVRVSTSQGRELIRLQPRRPAALEQPLSAAEPAPPRKIGTSDELYFIGLQLGQKRHPARHPEEYWLEGLRRDPHDARCNNAIALWYFHRGEFRQAEIHLRRAIATASVLSPNVYDGEPFYQLGLTLRYLDREAEAYDAFAKAAWNFAWRAPALHAIAELEIKRKRPGFAPRHLHETLRLNADNNEARNLAAFLFRRFGRADDSEHLVRESLMLDPLDAWACQLSGRAIPGGNQVRLDLAFDYSRAGLYDSAIELLQAADLQVLDGSVPIVHYALAYFHLQMSDPMKAWNEYEIAAQSPPDYCFPHRLDELVLLERAVSVQPEDARARYYLGNLLYGRRRYREAVAAWEEAARLNPTFATVWRNLGIAYFKALPNREKALDAFDKAFERDPADARILYERDQLWKCVGVAPTVRLAELKSHPNLPEQLNDLTTEIATLYNNLAQPEVALALLESRDHGASPLHTSIAVRARVRLGRKALESGDPAAARDFFADAILVSDHNAEALFWLGESFSALNDNTAAKNAWQRASDEKDGFSETTLFAALALDRLGERLASRRRLRELWFHGRRLTRAKPDSPVAESTLSQSGPDGCVIHYDPVKQTHIRGLFLQAQARYGLGQLKLARRLLDQVLALHPNHEGASDLSEQLSRAVPN